TGVQGGARPPSLTPERRPSRAAPRAQDLEHRTASGGPRAPDPDRRGARARRARGAPARPRGARPSENVPLETLTSRCVTDVRAASRGSPRGVSLLASRLPTSPEPPTRGGHMLEITTTHAVPPVARRPRVAVIGCGYWGVNYVRVFSELREAQLAAICEPRADRLAEIGSRFPAADLVVELDDLLVRDDIDAVVVATSATSHHSVTKRCLEAGKHVLVEKPLATTVAESAE